MNVLVLGGGGLLGKFLIPRLASANEIGVCDKLIGHNNYELPSNITLFTADATDLNSMRQVFRRFKPDVIVVSLAHHFNKDTVYSQYDDVNLVYRSANVLSYLLTPEVKHVVFCSSSEVYGGPQTSRKIKETRKIVIPSTSHGIAKLSAENLLQFRCAELGVDFTTLRIFDMYGPRSTFCSRTGMINFLIDTFQEGKKTAGLSGAKRGKDFVHVSDVADAVTHVVETKLCGLFNVGTGQKTTLIDVVKILAGMMSIPIPPVIMPDAAVATFSAVADTSHITKHIPTWNPKRITADTLQDILQMRTIKTKSSENLLAKFKQARGI